MRYLFHLVLGSLGLLALLFSSCNRSSQPMEYLHPNDSTTLVHIYKAQRYLLLPIQEEQPEVLVRLIGDRAEDTFLDIRLAVDSIDYYVPFPLPEGEECKIEIVGLGKEAITWQSLQLSDSFDTSKKDYYHPSYHHTPPYGWMNDPNGMFYKDGTYHLYYQYNPFGSKWGNMYWGHATSRDLIHWQTHEPALARDTLGHIFSGSTVIDRMGTAGFGKDAILAYYTAHRSLGGKQWQAQCLAYSTDNGMTYTKYQGNPILIPFDGVADFRDPKVFWYAPREAWYMIVSGDLKKWDYGSAFGEGYGARPNQFECPDFFELPMPETGERKWVMLVNINPGCPFGGSATEYFIGTFDGETFTPDTKPEVARWLDFGKDHYAFVTFHGVKERILGMPWTSNWQYANVTPFKQSRGMNGLPRELFLFSSAGRSYVGSRPAREVTTIRREQILQPDLMLRDSVLFSNLMKDYAGDFELELEFTPDPAVERVGFTLLNEEGDSLPVYLDMKQGRVVMDRTRSGITDFGEKATPHERESGDWRQREGLNYHNDFALSTWAPLELCVRRSYRLRLFIDRSLAELFVEDGRIAMTNLIFPHSPYTSLRLFSEGGKTKVTHFRLYHLSL